MSRANGGHLSRVTPVPTVRMTTRMIVTVVLIRRPRVRPHGNESLPRWGRLGTACLGVAGTRLPRQPASYLSSSQTLVPSRLLDPLHPPYHPTTPERVQIIMEGAEKSDKASLPLQIDPKWYVRRATSLESLTADRVQPPRRSQIFLPAHQDRGSSPRLLHNVQEGGNRVRHRLRQEV